MVNLSADWLSKPVNSLAGKEISAAIEKVECHVERLLACHAILSSLPSLRPAAEMHKIYSKLINACRRDLDSRTVAALIWGPEA